MKLEYVVVYERTSNNYCAYLPDLPGALVPEKRGKTFRKTYGRPSQVTLR